MNQQEARKEELAALGEAFARRTQRLVERGATEEELLAAARRADETADSLRWLRLVTAGYMRKERETFEPTVVQQV